MFDLFVPFKVYRVYCAANAVKKKAPYLLRPYLKCISTILKQQDCAQKGIFNLFCTSGLLDRRDKM